MRLEQDGQTVTQVTSTAAPITDFDVSSTTGALAYVSDNDIYLADYLGQSPRRCWMGRRPLSTVPIRCISFASHRRAANWLSLWVVSERWTSPPVG